MSSPPPSGTAPRAGPEPLYFRDSIWNTGFRSIGSRARPTPRAAPPDPETHHNFWRCQKSIAPDSDPIRRPPNDLRGGRGVHKRPTRGRMRLSRR